MTQETPPTPTPRGPARFELAMLALIVLSCSQLGYVGDPRKGPFIAAADVLCAVLFVAWVWKVTREQRWRKLLWPPYPVWTWLAVAALSVCMTIQDAEGSLSLGGIKGVFTEVAQIGLYFVVAYMMFVDVLNNVAKIRRACAVLLGAVSAVVLWGFADYLLRSEALDVKAGFATRNTYSAFLVMTVPLLFGVAIHERNRPQRRWVVALVAGAILTMLGPPHVWVMVAIVCWMAYVRGGRFPGYFVPLTIAAAVAVAVALPRNGDANFRELVDIHERGELYKLEVAGETESAPEGAGGEEAAPQDGSEEEPLIVKKRWLEWQPALMMLTENLPLGVGAGSYQARIGEAQYYGSLPNVKKSEPDTNNFYLVVGASMGLAGLVSVVALLGWFWHLARSLWLRANSQVERGLAAGLHGALAGIIIANLFTSMFVRGISVLWALVFAMVTVATREGISLMRRRAAEAEAQKPPPE